MPAVPRRLVLALAAAGLLAACSGGEAGDGAAGGSDSSAVAVDNGATLDADAFTQRVEADGTIVVDVRTPEEFASGHLPEALNLDLQSADFSDRVAELDPDATYAVYCRSGNRSAQAMQIMLDAGFTDVAHLDGGIGAWQSAGGDVVTGS